MRGGYGFAAQRDGPNDHHCCSGMGKALKEGRSDSVSPLLSHFVLSFRSWAANSRQLNCHWAAAEGESQLSAGLKTREPGQKGTFAVFSWSYEWRSAKPSHRHRAARCMSCDLPNSSISSLAGSGRRGCQFGALSGFPRQFGRANSHFRVGRGRTPLVSWVGCGCERPLICRSGSALPVLPVGLAQCTAKSAWHATLAMRPNRSPIISPSLFATGKGSKGDAVWRNRRGQQLVICG